MSVVNYAIAEINSEIPEEILKFTFGDSRSFVNQSSIIEQRIYEKVIDSRIRRKIDVVGPQELEIHLKNSWKNKIDLGSFEIVLPLEATKGKRLISVQSISIMRTPYNGATMGTGFNNLAGSGGHQNSYYSQMNKILTAGAPPVLYTTADIEIKSLI